MPVSIRTKISFFNMAGEQTSEYIPWDEYLRGLRYLKEENDHVVYLFALLGGFWGLRASELLALRWEDILDKDQIIIYASKGGKRREIKIVPDVRKAITEIHRNINPIDIRRLVFLNLKTGKPYTTHHFIKQLKELKKHARIKCGAISTHSLRKTFGRKYLDDQNYSDYAFTILGEIFRHESAWVTKRYLGITGEEIDSVYESFRL